MRNITTVLTDERTVMEHSHAVTFYEDGRRIGHSYNPVSRAALKAEGAMVIERMRLPRPEGIHGAGLAVDHPWFGGADQITNRAMRGRHGSEDDSE